MSLVIRRRSEVVGKLLCGIEWDALISAAAHFCAPGRSEQAGKWDKDGPLRRT